MSVRIISSFLVRRISAGSCDPMHTIITTSERIGRNNAWWVTQRAKGVSCLSRAELVVGMHEVKNRPSNLLAATNPSAGIRTAV